MSDDINFTDLVALSKISPEMTAERYGGAINSSLFDSANILGGLKQKGLIDFTTSLAGQNPILVTDAGKQVMAEAMEKSKADLDFLDQSIILQIHGGKRTPKDIGAAVNVRPKDLAMHLYRTAQQGYISYDFRAGAIDIMLTDKGFSQANSGLVQKAQQDQAAVPGAQPQAQIQQAAQTLPMQSPQQPQQVAPSAPAIDTPQSPLTVEEIEAKVRAAKAKGRIMLGLCIVILILVIIAAVFYTGMVQV